MPLRSPKEFGVNRISSGMASATVATVESPRSSEGPHDVCLEVRRNLLAHPSLRFSSLIIRRTRDGVCLEGMMDPPDGPTDVCDLAREVAGVNEVINRLLVRQHHRPPRKG